MQYDFPKTVVNFVLSLLNPSPIHKYVVEGIFIVKFALAVKQIYETSFILVNSAEFIVGKLAIDETLPSS